jgi:hypothetical protein
MRIIGRDEVITALDEIAHTIAGAIEPELLKFAIVIAYDDRPVLSSIPIRVPCASMTPAPPGRCPNPSQTYLKFSDHSVSMSLSVG